MRVPYMDIQANYVDTSHRRVLDLRPLGCAEIPMLGRYCYTQARPDLPLHRHQGGLEVCYLERGSQIFEVDRQPYHLRGGDLFVTFPDEPHSTGGNPSEPGVLYWLNVRLPKSNGHLLGLPRDESASLVDGLCHLPHRCFRATPHTKPAFNDLFELYDHPEISQHKTRLRQAVIRLLLETIDGAAQRARTTCSHRMAEVVGFIRGAVAEDFRLEDLAHRVHLSLSHFKRQFKIETGATPRQFILRTKIDAARRLLRTTDNSVSQIALDLGFVSSQYFATVFKRITGLTPREYRHATPLHGPSTRRDDGQDCDVVQNPKPNSSRSATVRSE